METEEILPELSDNEEEADWTKLSNKKRSLKRGEKEYEPLAGSSYDKTNLDRARAAMISALAAPRGVLTKPDALKHYTVWVDLDQCYMVNPRGKYLETMGQTDRSGKCWLTKVEAVYLVERGSCIARSVNFPEQLLSLHDLYALLFQQDRLHDRYLVYSHLKRCGYIVNESVEEPIQQAEPKASSTRIMTVLSSFLSPILAQFIPFFRRFVPLFTRGRFFSYSAIFKSLQIPRSSSKKQQSGFDHYKVSLSAWKPKERFSKKNPPCADFQVCIVSAQDDNFPSLTELQGLIGNDQCEAGFNVKEKVKNLKFGSQNKPVKLIAVVDNGLINFFSPRAVSFDTQGTIWNDACLLDKPGKYKKGKGGLLRTLFISY